MYTVMLRDHKREGQGVTAMTPISKKSTTQAGIWFVDDTIPWEGLDSSTDLETAVWKAQGGITFWGNLLIGTGRDFQLPMCKWTTHAMRTREDRR